MTTHQIPPRPSPDNNVRRMRALAVVVLVLFVVVAVVMKGCSIMEEHLRIPFDISGGDPKQIVTGFEHLTVGQTGEYWAAQATIISDRLVDRFGLEVLRAPESNGGESGVNCGPEEGFHEDGTYVSSVSVKGAVTEAIPEDRWDEAVEMVTEWAADYGYTEVVVVVNKPGNHSMKIFNPTSNGHIRFGQIKRSSIGINSPCTVMKASERGLKRAGFLDNTTQSQN